MAEQDTSRIRLSMVGAGINVIPFMIQRNVPGIGAYVLPAFLCAAVPAFFAGLAYDLMRPGPLGLSALAFSLVGFAVGSLLVSVLQVRRWLAAGIVVVATMVGELTAAVGAQLFGQNTLTNPRLWTIVAVVALVNGLLSPIVLRVARWAERRDELRPALGAVDG